MGVASIRTEHCECLQRAHRFCPPKLEAFVSWGGLRCTAQHMLPVPRDSTRLVVWSCVVFGGPK